jgi:hypothetical protein
LKPERWGSPFVQKHQETRRVTRDNIILIVIIIIYGMVRREVADGEDGP